MAAIITSSTESRWPPGPAGTATTFCSTNCTILAAPAAGLPIAWSECTHYSAVRSPWNCWYWLASSWCSRRRNFIKKPTPDSQFLLSSWIHVSGLSRYMCNFSHFLCYMLGFINILNDIWLFDLGKLYSTHTHTHISNMNGNQLINSQQFRNDLQYTEY
jgi:hypothetical protein